MFTDARGDNKGFATNILKWIEVDDLTIKKILGNN
jgi:hypothetical protein